MSDEANVNSREAVALELTKFVFNKTHSGSMKNPTKEEIFKTYEQSLKLTLGYGAEQVLVE